MSVRSLIGKIPHIAGCQDADRFAERNLMVFDLEVGNKVSTFAYRESDATLNRLAVLEIPSEYVGDSVVYRYAMDRIKIAMLSYDKSKGRITEENQKELDGLVNIAENSSPVDLVDDELDVLAATQSIWS